MPGPPPAVAAVRVAVRRALEDGPLAALASPTPPGERLPEAAPLLLVACSGGADSLALAAGAAFVAPRLGWRAGAVVVDHGLQEGSDRVAQEAADRCRGLGLDPVEVVRVEVGRTGEGPEADARAVRYAALADRADALGARAVLVGHTRDDQAEQVLLGLVRGSGARSLSGMAPWRELGSPGGDPWLGRPLLGLTRRQTWQACVDLGLDPWQDPHNEDPRYARVRTRLALLDLEHRLGAGVVVGLARSADLLRDDADALDEAARAAYLDVGPPPWEVTWLRDLPRAVRTRLWRLAALAAGSPGTDLTSEHLLAVDALVTAWHGQGPLHLPGGVRAARAGEEVRITGQA